LLPVSSIRSPCIFEHEADKTFASATVPDSTKTALSANGLKTRIV
jgi:hypothetical protein